MRLSILDNIQSMEDEFRAQIDKIITVCQPQLDLYDAMEGVNPDWKEPAIETIANLEKLSSPTQWTSPDGSVRLKHLSIPEGQRTPWSGKWDAAGHQLVYTSAKPLSAEAMARVQTFAQRVDLNCAVNPQGNAVIFVPQDKAEAFFEAMSEDNVSHETHPFEAADRDLEQIIVDVTN